MYTIRARARRLCQLCLAGCLLGTLGCGSLLQSEVKTQRVELREGNYELDPRHATVLFNVDHLGLAKFVGRFNEFDAQLDFDPDDPASTRLSAVITTASVDVNDDDFSRTLAGSSWLNSAKFPYATFESSDVEFLDNNVARFNGQLTLLGVSAPISLNVVFNGGAFNILTGRYTLGFSATASVERSAFGMDNYLSMVGDTVDIEVHAEFLRR